MNKIICTLALVFAIAFAASAQTKEPVIKDPILRVYKVAGTDLVYKTPSIYDLKKEDIESVKVDKTQGVIITITLTKPGFDAQTEEFRNKFQHETK